MLASDMAIACICNFSIDGTKGVPNGRAFAIAVMGTLDLKSRGGDAPLKVLGEMVT
jgi:hypothetical protein